MSRDLRLKLEKLYAMLELVVVLEKSMDETRDER
jgi:hypothetical protein